VLNLPTSAKTRQSAMLPEHAERFAEYPRIGGPDGVGLLRQAKQQHEQVGHSQVEQAVVGRRVHVVVAGDHYARRHVSDEASHKDQRVDDRHRHCRRDVLLARSQDQFQIDSRGPADGTRVRSRVVGGRIGGEQFACWIQKELDFGCCLHRREPEDAAADAVTWQSATRFYAGRLTNSLTNSHQMHLADKLS